jgi:hypothetical protein
MYLGGAVMRGKSPLITLLFKIIMALIARVLCQDLEIQAADGYEYNIQINGRSTSYFSHMELKS